MTETPRILVTGASGQTGRLCVLRLLGAKVPVRALVRRSAAADDLRAAGVQELTFGDLTDRDVLRRAVDGVSTVLHICPPMHPLETEIASWLIDEAKFAGVSHFILYSVLHPCIDVPHHRRKLVAEAYLINSGLPYTILQPARYMQHLHRIWSEVVRDNLHSMPFSVDQGFSLVDLRDLADVCCRVAREAGHDFATYQLAGPEILSQIDCARFLSGLLGRPILARAKPLSVFLRQLETAGASEERLAVMRVMNEHYDRHGLIGNANVLRLLLGREPRTFEDYARSLLAV